MNIRLCKVVSEVFMEVLVNKLVVEGGMDMSC